MAKRYVVPNPDLLPPPLKVTSEHGPWWPIGMAPVHGEGRYIIEVDDDDHACWLYASGRREGTVGSWQRAVEIGSWVVMDFNPFDCDIKEDE